MSNNPNHFNRKQVNTGSFRAVIPSSPELVFTTRPHIHRPYMNGMYFKQNGKTYKIISGGYDARGDIVKFEEVIKNAKGTVYSVTEKEFFGKVDKSDLKSTL